VPDEGFEPSTFGLQNHCSTTELIRLQSLTSYRKVGRVVILYLQFP
jgi:hypothetical protein